MRKAVFLTAYNRIPYLQEVLHSWESVRQMAEWDFVAMIEPSPVAQQIKEEFEEFGLKTGWKTFTVIINPEIYGVLHHPWVGFENLFEDHDFVVRAEDDLLVSDDILEYFTAAATEFQGDESVATIHAFSLGEGPTDLAVVTDGFSPWLWGTWRNRWVSVIGPTWDHNYSTNNGTPGEQAGWDWNLNTRIFPQLDLHSVGPIISRSASIGLWGVHGTPDNHQDCPNFVNAQPSVEWKFVDSRVHG